MDFSSCGKEIRKFDQVNRMAIPPSFREELGTTVYILKSIHEEPCLLLMSNDSWQAFNEKFTSKLSGKQLIAAQRWLANRVDKAAVDKSGRITIKDEFKAYANLDEDVYVVGIMNRIELWNYDAWIETTSGYNSESFDLSFMDYN